MKNTFKKPVITYEPIEQPKRSYWMHSIDGIEQRKDTFSSVSSAIAILVSLGLMVTLIHIVGG